MDQTLSARRSWLGLAVLALPTFVVAIDLFVLLLALPELSVDLGADGVAQLWITDVYGFLLAGFTITMGTLADRIGRRRLLTVGTAAFAVASILCAYADSVWLLITARALLGVAGATIGPSTLGLIGALFADPERRARAFGVWGGVYTLGALLGPVIGGLLLARFWWGSVFLLGVPIMVVALLLGRWLLPRDGDRRPGRLDLISAGLSLLAALPIVYAIKEFARQGLTPEPLAALLLGLAAGALFVRRQRRSADPMLDLNLFGNRVITASLIGQLAVAGFGAAFNLLLVLYFQLVTGLTPLQTGLAMVPGMITAALGFQLAPRLAARFRPGTVIAVGLALEAAVLLVMVQHVGPASLIIGFALTAFGIPAVGLGTALVIGAAPPAQLGLAGSVAQIAGEFGGMLGIALFGTLAAVVYRGTPGVGDSLAGAAAEAAALPEPQAAALLAAARAAYTSGLIMVAVTGAVILAGAAVLIFVRLRHLPPFGTPS